MIAPAAIHAAATTFKAKLAQIARQTPKDDVPELPPENRDN